MNYLLHPVTILFGLIGVIIFILVADYYLVDAYNWIKQKLILIKVVFILFNIGRKMPKGKDKDELARSLALTVHIIFSGEEKK